MNRRLTIPAMLILLAACTATAPVPPADVAALESGLTIAETLATNYTSLPACPVASNVCADPQIKASIKAYDLKAYTAIKTVEASHLPADLAVAQAALAAFQTSIPATK